MIILGINAYHGDSSACLVRDGKLLCAIEEERIRRIKHWAGFPAESIKWCLKYSGVDIKDVDYIAISASKAKHVPERVIKILINLPKDTAIKDMFRRIGKIINIKGDIAKSFGTHTSNIKAKVKGIEHHRAHIGSSFLVSPFEEAICVSVDGLGDGLSVMRGIGKENKIKIIDSVKYPHSLGYFYTAFTQLLGFWKYGGEYKVMGLSAYGKPIYMDKMRKIVKFKNNGLFELDVSYFIHDKENISMTWENCEPFIGRMFSDKLVELFGKPREEKEEITEHHQNIASSMQTMYEKTFFHILDDIYKKYKIERLALAGGCIQNSVANGKVFEKTPFKEVYIPPSAHDGGTAIGAAFWIWNVLLGNKRGFVMDNSYWGPEFSDNEIEKILLEKSIKYEKMDEEELLNKTAENIANGKIVGWFEGRTEWGPRALGNRSILVNPQRREMKDLLNQRIKKRESFRPFAPSILEDYTSEWFENHSQAPFMEKVYRIKDAKRTFIPAVTHIDGTGRLQTVSQKTNPKYYRLINEFNKLTNVPIVLNTSFNENEPIVNTPKDALNCFLKTKMDILVLGNFFVTK